MSCRVIYLKFNILHVFCQLNIVRASGYLMRIVEVLANWLGHTNINYMCIFYINGSLLASSRHIRFSLGSLRE